MTVLAEQEKAPPTVEAAAPDGSDCPICGEGKVSNFRQDSKCTHMGVTGTVSLHLKVCDTCTSEYAGAEESTKNLAEVTAFKAEISTRLSAAGL